MIEEGPWAIGGAIAARIAAAVAIFGFAYELWFNHFSPVMLKKPCKSWFCISSSKQRKVTYAEQDSREHLVEELTSTPRSTIHMNSLRSAKAGHVAGEGVEPDEPGPRPCTKISAGSAPTSS